LKKKKKNVLHHLLGLYDPNNGKYFVDVSSSPFIYFLFFTKRTIPVQRKKRKSATMLTIEITAELIYHEFEYYISAKLRTQIKVH